MTKATIKITGEDLREFLTQAIAEFQNDEYTVHYEMDSGSVFMFDQY